MDFSLIFFGFLPGNSTRMIVAGEERCAGGAAGFFFISPRFFFISPRLFFGFLPENSTRMIVAGEERCAGGGLDFSLIFFWISP